MSYNNDNSLFSKLRSRMASQIGHRGDMHLSDYKISTANTAKILLAYDGDLGNITGDDIRSWVNKSFGGKLTPLMSTARVHQEDGAVSLFVEKYAQKRPLGDAEEEGMIRVASNRMIDKFAEVWEVREADSGERYLARLVKDDIEELLKERRARMLVKERSASFASLRTAGVVHLYSGDRVRYYDGRRVGKGEVMSVMPQAVKIKADTGMMVDVDSEAVLDILARSPQHQEMKREREREYYERAFGDAEYANKLTKGEY